MNLSSNYGRIFPDSPSRRKVPEPAVRFMDEAEPWRCGHAMDVMDVMDVMPGWIAADLVLGAKFAERDVLRIHRGVPKVTLAYFGNHSTSAVHFGCWLISSNLENNWNRCSEEE